MIAIRYKELSTRKFSAYLGTYSNVGEDKGKHKFYLKTQALYTGRYSMGKLEALF